MTTEFFKYLVKITKGFFTDEKIDRLIHVFEKASDNYFIDSQAEANLIRIINALFDKLFFLDECLRYPIFSDSLISIAVNSNYMSDILVMNPELIYLVVDSNFINTKVSAKKIENDFKIFSNKAKSFNAKINYLKSQQRKYILKIGVEDIIYRKNLPQITRQISTLATIICKITFSECLQIITTKYNIKKFPVKFSLCALGKLGGKELNYSSDIDLILFYDDSSLSSKLKDIYHLILSDAAKLFIKSLSEVTDKGFLYRVDFRLRPDGIYSPLCLSLGQMINYYDTRSEEWERQMLIKLSFVCGDIKIFNSFYSFVRRYIYFNVSSRSPLTTIKLMKEKIEKYHEITGNLKTAPGGIRDIEFIVQALQIINGKNYPGLRSANTLTALRHLKKNRFLSEAEYKLLKQSYIFFRRIEHLLQLMNNRQTHTIPEDVTLKHKLSKLMNFSDAQNFERELENKMMMVRKIFNSLTGQSIDYQESLSKIFVNPARAKSNIDYLSRGSGHSQIKTFDKYVIQKFDEIQNFLFEYLSNCTFPDRALENFVKLTRLNSHIGNWYSFLNNKNLFQDIMRVCEFSQMSIDNILTTNETSAENIVSDFFVKIDKELNYNQNNIVKSILAAQYVLGFINQNQLTELYSNYIRHNLISVANNIFEQNEICIIALGSLAVGEMNFFSDVDLIVITESLSDAIYFENKLIQFIREANEKIKGTKIDFRLRPEGKNSVLIGNLDCYKNYYSNRARVWEFYALLKSDFLCGNFQIYENFKKFINDIQKSISHERLLTESNEVYHKLLSTFDKDSNLGFDLKKSHGGFMTIDFILSFNLIKSNLNLITNKKLIDFIKDLCSVDSKYKELTSLKSTYNFLKKILISFQIFFNKQTSRIPENEEMKYFYSWIGYKNKNHFENEFDILVKSNRELFKRFLT